MAREGADAGLQHLARAGHVDRQERLRRPDRWASRERLPAWRRRRARGRTGAASRAGASPASRYQPAARTTTSCTTAPTRPGVGARLGLHGEHRQVLLPAVSGTWTAACSPTTSPPAAPTSRAVPTPTSCRRPASARTTWPTDLAAGISRSAASVWNAPSRQTYRRSTAPRSTGLSSSSRGKSLIGFTRRSMPGTPTATRTSRRCGTSSTWTPPWLTAGGPRRKPTRRSRTLTSVGVNWYASVFSPSCVNYDLTCHDPDYRWAAWGALGQAGQPLRHGARPGR